MKPLNEPGRASSASGFSFSFSSIYCKLMPVPDICIKDKRALDLDRRIKCKKSEYRKLKYNFR